MLQYHWLYVFQVVSILLYHCYLLSIRNTKIDRWYRIHKIIHSKFKCIDVLFLLNGFPHTNMRGGLKVFDDGFLTHYEHGKPPILFKLSDQTIYIRFLFSVIKWSIAFFHFPSAKPTNKRESKKKTPQLFPYHHHHQANSHVLCFSHFKCRHFPHWTSERDMCNFITKIYILFVVIWYMDYTMPDIGVQLENRF